MNMKPLFTFTYFLICIMLFACAPLSLANNAMSTQAAEVIYSTQTAGAPTTTPTFTQTPTPTVTPTPTATSTATATSTPTNTPTPTLDPSVLFFDDFSGENTGWLELTNNNVSEKYVDGEYSILVDETDMCYWSTALRNYNDVIVEVDARKLRGPVVNEYGVICRLMDNENYYFFGVTSDGYYGMGKLIDNEWVDLGNSKWTFDDQVVNTGTGSNHLKVTCDSEELTMEVNGSTVITISDSDIKGGDVGLYVCAYDAPGVEVLFDNFLVTRP